jgi:hypothetical protein
MSSYRHVSCTDASINRPANVVASSCRRLEDGMGPKTTSGVHFRLFDAKVNSRKVKELTRVSDSSFQDPRPG